MATWSRVRALFVCLIITAAFSSAVAPVSSNAQYQPTPENLEARRWFQDAKFGLFIHWGVYSVLGDGEWVMNNRKMPVSEYEKLGAVQPDRIRSGGMGRAGQSRRDEIHHDHQQASRRLHHVRFEDQRLGHRRPHALQ